ncbi:MAG: glycosyltransferase family 2 protein [Candidatus Omnitrophica bacterium]|nr:glycosyltransferase family 2 protein [Candidatus Omnitrophota bacterium]
MSPDLFMQISVIIPVHNDYKHLELCLRSIQVADPQPQEVIVVDDGSTHDIGALVKEFPFAQVIRQKTRMGAGYARYIGVQAAKGDVVAFLDSDCYINPDWFGVICTHLRKDIGGIAGRYIPCNTDHFVAFYEIVDISTCYSRKTAAETKDVVGGCCAFWKHALLSINLKSSFVFGALAAGEDTLLGLEMKKKYKLLRVEAMKVYHHYHETWRQYFRKRFIDGWSHAVIFLLYNRDLRNAAYLKYPYIILNLALTAVLLYGLKSRSTLIVLSVFFILLYSEVNIFRTVFSSKKVIWRNKLGFFFMRLPCLLTRNACWLAGVTSGVGYYLINYGKLIRLTVSAESNTPT